MKPPPTRGAGRPRRFFIWRIEISEHHAFGVLASETESGIVGEPQIAPQPIKGDAMHAILRSVAECFDAFFEGRMTRKELAELAAGDAERRKLFGQRRRVALL